MSKLLDLWNLVIVWAFMRLGSRIFNVQQTWSKREGASPSVIHFADSQRHLNMAVRCHVELLDQQLEERQREKNEISKRR